MWVTNSPGRSAISDTGIMEVKRRNVYVHSCYTTSSFTLSEFVLGNLVFNAIDEMQLTSMCGSPSRHVKE